MNNNLYIKESGRSMIEMLGVLAIIGVLSVGGIAGYSKAMEKSKINKMLEQITQIATNIQTLYAQQTTFAGLNNRTAVSMGVIPSELVSGEDRLINSFGGNIYVENNPFDIHDGTFSIEIHSLPKSACMALATADWGTTSSSGVVGIAVGVLSGPATVVNISIDKDCEGEWGPVGSATHVACSGSLPLSPAIASSFCRENSAGFGVAIKYTK